tara:strand:+ start:1673 stop:2290 length:618 start_codon:yes stop_codon:yes gene_type:complete
MEISSEIKLKRFSKIISGHYSNFSQSQINSKDYAHINLFFLPLPWSILKAPSFYSEQSYAYDIWKPYRQAIVKVKLNNNLLTLENYKISNAERIAGAGLNTKLLLDIKAENLIYRKGCCMNFKELVSGYYLGTVELGENCLIKRENELTYLSSNVAIYKNKWISQDEGFSIKTKKKVWGSINGPFLFKKITSLSEKINKFWLYGK